MFVLAHSRGFGRPRPQHSARKRRPAVLESFSRGRHVTQSPRPEKGHGCIGPILRYPRNAPPRASTWPEIGHADAPSPPNATAHASRSDSFGVVAFTLMQTRTAPPRASTWPENGHADAPSSPFGSVLGSRIDCFGVVALPDIGQNTPYGCTTCAVFDYLHTFGAHYCV